MSPDLGIIMMAASILEKSGLRLICLWCGVTVFSGNTTEPVVTCNIKSVVLLQNDRHKWLCNQCLIEIIYKSKCFYFILMDIA